MVHVVTVEPVITTATALEFKFRSSDGAEHRGYEVIIPKRPIIVASKEGINEVESGSSSGPVNPVQVPSRSFGLAAWILSFWKRPFPKVALLQHAVSVLFNDALLLTDS
jgi:hypothetical protein